jgi:ribosomal 30S subunit maturation factor RimM
VGIKGDLKVVHDKSFENLYEGHLKKEFFCDINIIWLQIRSSIFKSSVLSSVQCKDFFRLNLEIINNREEADSFIGSQIKIPKEHLPNKLKLEKNNSNLINCKIINLSGKVLGIVEKVDGNGFHDWAFSGQIVIPLVDKHVKHVDLVHREILVDWEESW